MGFDVLSIPGGWTILYTCPPGMGGHDAVLSGNFSFSFSGDFSVFSASITVLFEELSELSLS